MARVSIIIIIIIAVIMVIATISFPGGKEDCLYANANGSFTFEEMNLKGRDFDMCTRKWTEFKKNNKSDTILFRLCRINALKFWNYGDYLTHPAYRLPYLSYEVLMSRRGAVVNKSGYQDF